MNPWVAGFGGVVAILAPEARAQECVPTGPEVCESGGVFSQIDNDCDGSVNTNGGAYLTSPPPFAPWASPLYRDADHDTYGDPAAKAWLCSPNADHDPSGWSTDSWDCDDTDPDVHTGATEACNDRDDNCNALVDEPTPDAYELPEDCVIHAVDQDQDGFGSDASDGYELCVCPGYASNPANQGQCPPDDVEFYWLVGECWSPDATDCRDVATNIHLGAAEHLNGFDDDCDGWLPAVEIDCDNDASYARVPNAYGAPVRPATAESLGLAPCTEVAAVPDLTCFDVALALACDPDTALWEVDTAILEELGLFSDGARVGQINPGCDDQNDCDDTCASRCSELAEVCDGVDNDCRRAEGTDLDLDGLPDAMEPDLVTWGWVPAAEVALDEAGLLYECDSLDPPQVEEALSACEPMETVEPPPPPPPVVQEDIAGCTTSHANRHCGCGTGGGPAWLGLLTLFVLPRRRLRG